MVLEASWVSFRLNVGPAQRQCRLHSGKLAFKLVRDAHFIQLSQFGIFDSFKQRLFLHHTNKPVCALLAYNTPIFVSFSVTYDSYLGTAVGAGIAASIPEQDTHEFYALLPAAVLFP